MMKKTSLIAISGKKQSGKNLVAKIIQWLVFKNVYETNATFSEYTTNSNLVRDWKVKMFAGKVKEMLCLITGCSMEDLENDKFKQSYMSEEWDRWKITHKGDNTIHYNTEEKALYYKSLGHKVEKVSMTYRTGLQLIGTDLFRDKFHPNTWINALFADYEKENSNYMVTRTEVSEGGILFKVPIVQVPRPKHIPLKWLISDVRFPNEVQAIKDRGGILLRVNRDWRIAALSLMKNTSSDGSEFLDKDLNRVPEHKSETELDDYKGFEFIVNNNESIEGLIEKVREILIKIKLI